MPRSPIVSKELIDEVFNGKADNFIRFINENEIKELDLSEGLKDICGIQYMIDHLFEDRDIYKSNFKNIVKALKYTPNVYSIKITSCMLDSDLVVDILDELGETNITKANFSGNFIREEFIPDIIRKTLKTKLTDLDLTDCIAFGMFSLHHEEDFKEIVAALGESNLKHFKIYDILSGTTIRNQDTSLNEILTKRLHEALVQKPYLPAKEMNDMRERKRKDRLAKIEEMKEEENRCEKELAAEHTKLLETIAGMFEPSEKRSKKGI